MNVTDIVIYIGIMVLNVDIILLLSMSSEFWPKTSNAGNIDVEHPA